MNDGNGPLDFQYLGDTFELSGGSIKNALLRAAYLAAQAGTAISMHLLESACITEYRELGKLISDDSLYKDLHSLSADLKSTTGGLARIMKGVEAGKGSLGKLVRDESLYNEARLTLTEARAALGGVKDAVANFKTVSAGLSEGKGTLGKLHLASRTQAAKMLA
jgi:hypothetical protein